MPTTSNFGWTTPADTDLVKDGALAIRTLGNGIDTSMAQLKGGTTGQVLSKTSNTDMAFTWVTQDDANAIQNTIVDAKGDLISASGNDVPARLAVGNNGETLVADSSTSTGLRWQGSQTAGKNGLINGGFDIWQRGTTITGNNFSYGADRWAFWRNNAGTGLTASQGSGLTGSQYTLKVQRIAGQTFTDAIYATYDMETADSYRFAGKTVTFSFYIRKGANYSGGDITAVIRSGTGTNQTLFNGYTGGANVASTTATINSTTTFQRVTLTGTVSSSATQIGVYITYTPTGTAGAADFIEIGQAQLELGSVATEFSRAGGTLAGELAACQRYYYRVTTVGLSDANYPYGISQNQSTTIARTVITFPVTMRTSAALSSTAANTFAVWEAGSNYTGTGIASVTASPYSHTVQVSVSSGLTAGRASAILSNANNTSFVEFSSEL